MLAWSVKNLCLRWCVYTYVHIIMIEISTRRFSSDSAWFDRVVICISEVHRGFNGIAMQVILRNVEFLFIPTIYSVTYM